MAARATIDPVAILKRNNTVSASEMSLLVDRFIQARRNRLAMQRDVDLLQKEENLLKEQIIADLTRTKIPVIGGQRGTVKLNEKIKPIAGDWPKLYAYVKQEDAFDLLQRRLLESAVKARWDEGITIPGVQEFKVFDLSISDQR